jgi:hypothetical protein
VITRVMIVTPRYDREFRELMERRVAGDPMVSVIEDRRQGQRRKRVTMMTGADRRKGDRRGRHRSGAGALIAMRDGAPSMPPPASSRVNGPAFSAHGAGH